MEHISMAGSTETPSGNAELPRGADACLAGERVAFTGILASMTHAEAGKLVERFGGQAGEHISRQTTLLVVGEEGWPLEADGQPSLKLQQTLNLQKQGLPIRIFGESEFLQVLGLHERREEIHQLYTPAMLSKLLELPVHLIRRWERQGLIRAVRRVHRLPYFDFREVASARRLSDLLSAGVSPGNIEESLRKLNSWLPDSVRPVEQLELLVRDARVIVRDGRGLYEASTRQRMFVFDAESVPDTEVHDEEPASIKIGLNQPTVPERCDWYVEGCRRMVDGDLKAAEEAFRNCVLEERENPEAHFQLAECLYRRDNPAGARERYSIAVELDHKYVEAWVQLGCVEQQLGDEQAGERSFRRALEIHPDFPDAHIHLGESLYGRGQAQEAIPHWEAYLRFDSRGAWADLARQRLAFEAEESNEIEPSAE